MRKLARSVPFCLAKSPSFGEPKIAQRSTYLGFLDPHPLGAPSWDGGRGHTGLVTTAGRRAASVIVAAVGMLHTTYTNAPMAGGTYDG